jgi:hypothetical protein
LVPLKRSPEFRQIRPGLLGRAPHHPVDSWQEDGFHFFVFAVTANGVNLSTTTNQTPVAVFAMHHDVGEPVSGVIVTPREDGTAEVRSLRDPDVTYSAPLPA